MTRGLEGMDSGRLGQTVVLLRSFAMMKTRNPALMIELEFVCCAAGSVLCHFYFVALSLTLMV